MSVEQPSMATNPPAFAVMLGSCPSEVPIVVLNNPGLLPKLWPTATASTVDGALLYDPFGPD
jgi:hypothetical protein